MIIKREYWLTEETIELGKTDIVEHMKQTMFNEIFEHIKNSDLPEKEEF